MTKLQFRLGTYFTLKRECDSNLFFEFNFGTNTNNMIKGKTKESSRVDSKIITEFS